MYRLVFVFFLLISSFSTIAQRSDTSPPAFPTLNAINTTLIPIADRVALASRLSGVNLSDLVADPMPLARTGDTASFWVQNLNADRTFQTTATVVYAGVHLVAWLEDGRDVNADDLTEIVRLFDDRVYQQVRDVWGSEPSPGIDGDMRVHVLFAGNMGNGVGAYFSARHTFPDGITSNSNAREMFFYNVDTMPTSPQVEATVATLAHEFQHMIRFAVDDNDPAWVDEGFSSFTEIFLGYSTANWTIESYLNNPNAQLNSWRTDDAPTSAHYGASVLFLTYLYDRFGIALLQAFSADSRDGLSSLDAILADYDTSVDAVFADWLITNALNLPPSQAVDTRYSYQSVTLPQSPVSSLETTDYPAELGAISNQYSGTYVDVQNLQNAEQLTVSINAPNEVPLIPVDAYSGQWMWYSHRGDTMDSTLTRAFDLTDVQSATLEFQVWHDIEDNWDYGYVMVSTDDGTTWDILSTDATTTFNPYGNAYGAGYTGQSGEWLPQSISLDAYAGRQIQIRFEMITDDALNLNNMAIDDVSIPEIGYFSDFETGDDGWITNGWMRIDNRLPQRYHVIFLHTVAGETVIWQETHSGTGTWEIPLDPASDDGVLIVAPLADITTVPMLYELMVDVE